MHSIEIYLKGKKRDKISGYTYLFGGVKCHNDILYLGGDLSYEKIFCSLFGFVLV